MRQLRRLKASEVSVLELLAGWLGRAASLFTHNSNNAREAFVKNAKLAITTTAKMIVPASTQFDFEIISKTMPNTSIAAKLMM